MAKKDDIAKKQAELENSVINDPRLPGITRRGFLQRATILAGGGIAAAALGGCAPSAAAGKDTAGASDATGVDTDAILTEIYSGSRYGHSPILAPHTFQNHLAEPPIPGNQKLADVGIQSEYDVDVLVVGGGFAGIYAADQSHKMGKKTLLVDKGIVGHSGLTPWAHTFAYFDEDLGDDRQACLDLAAFDSEYSANLDYFNQFLDRSKEIYEEAQEWGWLHVHDWSTLDDNSKIPSAQAQEHLDTDRRKLLHQHVSDAGFDFIERVMITDIIKEDDRIQGAVGFFVESDEPIVIKAKSVILCCGPGSVRPSGFPTGSSTWDGDGMAYRAGAGIGGKEYTDFHWTLADAPGDIYTMWWRGFLEGQLLFPAHFPSDSNMMSDVFQVDANGGFITPDRSLTDEILLAEKEAIEAGQGAMPAGPVIAAEDPRKALGTTITPDYLWINREVKECAIGMGLPKEEGVWPVDDKCWSGINGLWAAGDGLASCMCGSAYACMGASSVSSCIQGRVAAEQACAYVDTAKAANPSTEAISALTNKLLAPIKKEVGFSPEWAEEILCNIMAPYWVSYMKSEETLTAALTQLTTARNKIIGNLRARSIHELRYCHEMENKFLNCEMKLRAGLFRTESRGMHYRYDFPYRNDDEWLAFVVIKQGENGEMELSKEQMKEEWCGDRSVPHAERYPRRMPGDLKALGISE